MRKNERARHNGKYGRNERGIKMLYDTTLQQNLITALLKKPSEWLSINSFFCESDIYDDDMPDSTIISIIRRSVESGEEINGNIVAQRIEQLNLNHKGDLPISRYVLGLSKRGSEDGAAFKIARELKKLSVRRELAKTGQELSKAMEKIDPSSSFIDIIQTADGIYNKKINHFELDSDLPVNIYDDIEEVIENMGKEQKEEIFGRFEILNRIYGSLHEPGNVTTIVARSAAGKTTLALDECCFVGDKYKIPVLHLDNGEMSKEELQLRRISALSGVSHYLIKKGKWRNIPETCKKVRDAIQKIKENYSKFIYYSVAGMGVDDIIDIARRYYYNEVGRGNKMIISFDYIKPPDSAGSNSPEWQVLGDLVNRLKRFIQKEIVFDGKPMISIFTSAQANRSGVTTNKKANQIVDDESIISGADRIIHYSSHAFILRKKVMEEIMNEGPQFGTHKLIRIKARHLGEDVAGDLEYVKFGDELVQNFINLDFSNFSVEERGDLRDIVKAKSTNPKLQTSDHDEPPPF